MLGGETDNDDLEGGEEFDHKASLCRCLLCVRVSGLFCCRVFCCLLAFVCDDVYLYLYLCVAC